MGQNNSILGGHLNTISNSSDCTIINGANNQVYGATNVHVIGDDVVVRGAGDTAGSADNDNCFYVGCLNGIYVDGPIVANGNITAEGDIIAYASSDERLKDDIVPISGCLDKVLSLDAIEFDWNDKQQTYTGHDIGLIAQQVQEIAPEIVTEREDGYLAMKYEKMIPLLVGATQEQNAQLDELEKQLQELLNKSTG
jgi:hypothetical protein